MNAEMLGEMHLLNSSEEHMNIITKQNKFEELSDIKYEVHIGNSYIVDYQTIMILKFIGVYGLGSSGNSDATFMCAIGKAALEAWDPSGLIIDLSDLSYQWGDLLERVFDIGNDKYIDAPFPLALIVGNSSEEAVRTLLLGIDSKKTIKEIGWVFKDLKDAWTYIENKM
ncbi:hypothetical protein [Paenibacillus harenae]|uniref:hypothetical protein n=1 Tax=Paenibacillus harenae TaxID=306543 RepID=UPI002793610C|nr:hypothetical protein [Paenibacillus harenae]MDQ0059988.1 hypothetical protein [Paenibacillus harenae]